MKSEWKMLRLFTLYRCDFGTVDGREKPVTELDEGKVTEDAKKNYREYRVSFREQEGEAKGEVRGKCSADPN